MQHKPTYSDNGITYWPCYAAGKALIILSSVCAVVFLLISLWTLLGNATAETQWKILISIPIVGIIWCMAYKISLRTMYTKIFISNTGVVYSNNRTNSKVQINWDDVIAIYFVQEQWYGRQSCKIYLKNTTCSMPQQNDPCDLVLPVSSVDKQKMLQVIPVHLQKNSPTWF